MNDLTDPKKLRRRLDSEENLSWTEVVRTAVQLALSTNKWDDIALCLGINGYPAEVAAIQVEKHFGCGRVLELLRDGCKDIKVVSALRIDASRLSIEIEYLSKGKELNEKHTESFIIHNYTP